MKIFLIVLAVIFGILFLLALIPVGVRVRYDEDGFFAFAKVWLFRFQVFPAKEKKEKKEKPKKEKKPKEEKEEPEDEEKPKKKGGSLQLVQSALPLVKPALVGLKRRLTLKNLDLHVTWAANDPADAAIGYGMANAALGSLWTVVDQNFKVKKSRLGASVDFDQSSPSVFADGTLTIRIGQILTLGIPLLIRFFRNYSRIKREQAKKTDEK